MSVGLELKEGLPLRHPLVVCSCDRVIILSLLLFLAKNAAAKGYHGYHIMKLASGMITAAKECLVCG